MNLTGVIKCLMLSIFWISFFGFTVLGEMVDLSFHGLKTGEFFTDIQKKLKIDEVTHLNLSGNHFNSFIDCSTSLDSLQVLDLSQNNLEKFLFLCRTEYNLTFLNVSHNHLEYINDNALNSRVSKLKVLDISNNRMTGINDTMLEHMRNLEFLSLAHNPICDYMDEYVFENLTHLKVLNLRNISSTFFSPVLFEGLSNLTDLDLSMNPIEVIPVLPKSIEVLDISETNILNLGNLILPKLHTLQINNMPNLTMALLNYLENLTNLKTLSFTGSAKLAHLKVWPPNAKLLPQLQYLSVRNCALESISTELRPILQRTTTLHLQNNPWMCDCHMKWVYEEKFKSDLKREIKCYSPSHHRNKYLMQIPEQELQCEGSSEMAYTALWICFILMIGCALVGLVFLVKISLRKWPMIQKNLKRETVSYANVVESSNDLVRILSDGDMGHRNED